MFCDTHCPVNLYDLLKLPCDTRDSEIQFRRVLCSHFDAAQVFLKYISEFPERQDNGIGT